MALGRGDTTAAANHLRDSAQLRVDAEANYPQRHRQRMDAFRSRLAAALIVFLFAVIVTSILKGGNGEQVGQVAAPVSGLAGIALGWLFSGGRSE